MNFSPELNILIFCLKRYFVPGQENMELPANQKIDFIRLGQLVKYHKIRPLISEFDKKSPFLNDLLKIEFQNFTKDQTLNSLRYVTEIKRLNQVFREADLEYFFMKGNIFTFRFFGNKQLRESGDIDIVFHPNSIKKALEILLEQGFEIVLNSKILQNVTDQEKINLLVTANNQYEVPLFKDHIHLDIHWGIFYGFLPHQIPFEGFFERQTNLDFFGTPIPQLSTEDLFWVLLNHNGAKEFWLNFKNLADLMAFLNTYGAEIDWNKILNQAVEYKVKNILLNGFCILQKVFSYPVPEEMLSELKIYNFKASKQTFDYWERGKHWGKPFARLFFELVLLKSQDTGFNRWEYFRGFYNSYTIPNPIEDQRFIRFPNRFHFLNFVSKTISYLIRKSFRI